MDHSKPKKIKLDSDVRDQDESDQDESDQEDPSAKEIAYATNLNDTLCFLDDETDVSKYLDRDYHQREEDGMSLYEELDAPAAHIFGILDIKTAELRPRWDSIEHYSNGSVQAFVADLKQNAQRFKITKFVARELIYSGGSESYAMDGELLRLLPEILNDIVDADKVKLVLNDKKFKELLKSPGDLDKALEQIARRDDLEFWVCCSAKLTFANFIGFMKKTRFPKNYRFILAKIEDFERRYFQEFTKKKSFAYMPEYVEISIERSKREEERNKTIGALVQFPGVNWKKNPAAKAGEAGDVFELKKEDGSVLKCSVYYSKIVYLVS